MLLNEWEIEQESIKTPGIEEFASAELTGGISVTSPLTASVWKIKCKQGDEVKDADAALVVLGRRHFISIQRTTDCPLAEAMKTEINVTAGSLNVGKTVVGFGRGLKEGAIVSAGDIIVMLQ